MTPAGFERLCVKRAGGVDSLLLADAGDVESAVYDPVSKVFISISLRAGAAFARYDFKEDSCLLAEAVHRSGGAVSVKHEVAFTIPGYNGVSSNASAEMASSLNGFVAIVVTSDGEVFLVGYSHTFGCERPLRLVSVNYTTGARREDAAGSSVTLSSEDTDFSCPYTGALPR